MGDVSSLKPPNTAAPRETVNFGYHKSKTGKNMKKEAIDVRKGTGFDKPQCILQNNVILNRVMIGLVSDKNYHQKTKWQAVKKFTKLNQNAFQDWRK